MDHEISCLLGWLRTFPLQCQATAPTDLSDGLAMAEVLVQIEPATFTPTWFAGLLKSAKSNLETLDTLLNMLLHYYTHNLTEDCIAGNLPVPELSSSQSDLDIGLDNISSFLKLILGVAVTCSNKVLFINKIQSLDETTQHALTACIVSFISTKDWSEKTASTDPSEQVMETPELKLSPSGDEVWAQKVHELDYQVALLKEERINLMTENEELFGKVKAAQTLSRKDSLKSRHLESELTHMKDEFERLKAEYDETRAAMAAIDQKLKSEPREESGVQKLHEDITALKADFSRLQTNLTSRETGRLAGENVSHRLESQQELINELKHELHYQASLQARLSEELSCVKDQLDVMREQFHQYSSYSGELGDIRTRINELETTREDMMGDILRQQQLHSFSVTSNESVEYLTITNVSQANESLDTPTNANVSQANNQLDETLVFPTQVPLECSSGQPHLEVERESLTLVASVQEDEREESELGELEDTEGTTTTSTHPLTARTSEEKDSLDGEDSEGCETERRFRNIEDWNFSSVQTVDEKSIDEDHQNGLIDKIFRRDKAPTETDEVDKSPGCFSSWMLPFFVKVFD